MENPGYLVETCLLTFGLASIDDEALAKRWDIPEARFCWLEKGDIVIGAIGEYLRFRATKPKNKFARDILDKGMAEGATGAMTASATMEVCRRYNIPYAVSCGIGGIGDIKGEEICVDLPSLRDLPVVLVATSPKDMLDISASIGWLKDAGVTVVGDGSAFCTGYLFNGIPVELDGCFLPQICRPPLLILRGIPDDRRLADLSLLEKAVREAKEAEKAGGYYHPAANAALDRLSGGYTSLIQLESLLDNVRFTAALIENCNTAL